RPSPPESAVATNIRRARRFIGIHPVYASIIGSNCIRRNKRSRVGLLCSHVARTRLVMTLPRRRFLQLASGAAALCAMAGRAEAQSYPARLVRIVVGFPAGQGIDIIIRLVAQSLSERLGQQFVVDNRPGAGGNIATEAVLRAPADGYTLLATGSNNC